MEKQQPTLSLRVINSDQLESGKSASCLFSAQGGTVGSSEGHLWSVQDQKGNINPSQFTIQWRDGAFCLQMIAGPLFVNQSPLTSDTGFIRLQQGDEITVGKLVIKSHISFSDADRIDPMMVSPESLVSSYSNPLDAMMEKDPVQDTTYTDHRSLAPTINHDFSHDPLKVLDSENLTTLDQTPVSNEINQSLQQGHYNTPLFFSPLSDNRGNAMDRDFVDLPSISSPLSEQYQNMEQQHVAITPLMRGLSAHLPLHNSQQANDFLEEMGKTMKAAIEGLLALQRAQHGLRDKQLRPIEDNPLRLNMDYDTTMQVMFADQKSPVHLSAPSAIAESLHNLQLHYQANRIAITTALNTMLDAFSPEHLLNRFAQYRRSNETQEKDATWAWEMYTSYYRELASSRQQGFEKLFSEVYEQAYDRALRQGLEDSQ
ncbi:type VI secretion system-associated FHA domain protein TagH [Photorhabdus tasmaniensis]|uniref:type VI secretion system-associated FHA domain protein TagH n=1 Tax=Photorhabdus sp. RM323S TaxID=3342828 RepID=UPI0036DA947D